MKRKRLLVISSAPAQLLDSGSNPRVFLDKKFVEGMRFYADGWDGDVDCMLTIGSQPVPFGSTYRASELPFGLQLVSADAELTAETFDGYDVVLCSGDNHRYLDAAKICAKLPTRLFYVIEYIVETRLQIIFLDPEKRLVPKLRSVVWTLLQEYRRRRAFRLANGLQANGYPAAAAYAKMNGNLLFYLDNRIGADLLASDEDMQARCSRLRLGAPLRLIHSGRLEPMKGAQDLIPVARRLQDRGVAFELHIFGTGRLEAEMRRDAVSYGLQDRIVFHGVVDFDTELVPFARRHADVFLSCHRQSDPSCTYIESMGCGLAVAGYDNRMWQGLCASSGGGWTVSLGDLDAMANTLCRLAQAPNEIAEKCHAAYCFASQYIFEHQFRLRLDQLSHH